MSTTDRMPSLDSRREIVDRIGETVILGNSVGSGAVDEQAVIVFGAAGESRATGDMDLDAAGSLEFQNASFGIWAVDLDIDAAALLISSGAAIGSAPALMATASLLSLAADASLLNIRVFTTTQGYTPTTGTSKVFVWCLGGGGGGGGTSATAAGTGSVSGGGGSSAFAMGLVTSGFSGITITVGAGGTAGGAGSEAGQGGATSFGSFLISGGGGPGTGDAGNGVAPRALGGGNPGFASGTASLFGASGVYGSDGKFAATSAGEGGYGGATIFGGVRGTGNIPIAGIGFGGGGSGAVSVDGAAGRLGGVGAPGICIVFEFNA